MYKIEFDDKAKLLTLTHWGFWDVDLVRTYTAELAAVMSNLRLRARNFNILVDNRDFPVQSAEVLEAFGAVMVELQRPVGRTAILTANVLSKLQTKRLAAAESVQIFFDEQQARAWVA